MALVWVLGVRVLLGSWGLGGTGVAGTLGFGGTGVAGGTGDGTRPTRDLGSAQN